jgi:CRP-like cAMP-binding protein
MEVFFKYVEKYVSLTVDEKALVLSKLKSKTYLKGQYIVQSGDINRSQNFVVTGKVRSFFLDNSGNEHIVSFGIENWWVGDLCSFTTQGPADYNVQCLDKTQVIQISFSDLELLYQDIPKMERLFRLIIQKAYANTQKRVVRSFSLTAQERYLLFCEEYPKILQRVPQYMVASYLGITKEFLSTIKKRIADEARS